MSDMPKSVSCQRCGWGGVEYECQEEGRCPECNWDMSLADIFICKKCGGECQEVWHVTFKDYECEKCGQVFNSGGQEIAHPFGADNELLSEEVY
jgi:hypothetical protein